jgi:hypothetical protein
MGIKKYVRHGVDVYRLFHVPVRYTCSVEAYAAAGLLGKSIAAKGPRIAGMGLVVVLGEFVRPNPAMDKNV